MKRRRILMVALALILLVSGCATRQMEISREQIVAAYEEAGYEVWSRVYEEKLDYGEIAYVQANHPDGGYIYFSIFETEAEAKAYKQEFYHPVAVGLFSVIFGQPTWQRWKVYGCIVAQYGDSDMLTPVQRLQSGK